MSKTNSTVNAIATKPRGFAAMTPERQRQVASLGGRMAHESGNAHQFTSEEAREAGKKRHQKLLPDAGTTTA